MLLREERRTGKGERRGGWAARGGHSGGSLGSAGPDGLPDSRPAGRSQPGLPRRLLARAPSRGTPPAAARRPGESRQTPSALGGGRAPARAGTHPAAPARRDARSPAGSSRGRRGIPGTPLRVHTHIHTHTHTHTHTHARTHTQPAGGRLAALPGRTSRRYSLLAFFVKFHTRGKM
ncbi:voltage-dependent calcium channel beta subunit-associated regulatory protein-like [Panthera pardus]|uniref:Voltage-dependent calcium channel beta subunit-associated regulatory protein-like n=1 Tax=Panthera pardus TaxID=9691 RepID=A0A9W2V0B8_PANPR|nr:voltage-dependent calcium channel beta subunit-associated regulatory protein-like [Panthera pardus]